MADKSNPRVAVSVTGGAAEGGGLAGVQELLTLLPALSLVLQQPVLLVLTPFRTALRLALRSYAICSQLPGSMSASLRSHLHTSLKHSAGWPVRRCPVASSPYSTSFGYAVITHAMHVAEPAQPALTEEEVYAVRASTPQHSSIGDLVLPSNAWDAMQAAEVKALQAVFLSCVGCP